MDLLSKGFNEFAIDLFRQIYTSRSQADENVIMSSFSVAIAMMMALGGARNDTASQIVASLHVRPFLDHNNKIEETPVLLHESLRSLIRSILTDGNDADNQLRLANKILLNDIEPSDEFLELIRNTYESDVSRVEDGSFEKLADETNRWVRETTNGKIDSIVDAATLRDTSIALVNVIYFKQSWAFEFDESQTRHGEMFQVDSQRRVLVDMMNLGKRSLGYAFSHTLQSQLVVVPYKNEKFTFNALLPVDEFDFLLAANQQSLINRVSYETLVELQKSASKQKIYFAMPKFTIKKKMTLNQPLVKLGMESAFESRKANFSGITDSNNLYINEVLQYAFIEVNEKGTEAAAATVVRMKKRSIEHVTSVVLNRPFVYFITETSSNLILFMGTFNGEVAQGSAAALVAAQPTREQRSEEL